MRVTAVEPLREVRRNVSKGLKREELRMVQPEHRVRSDRQVSVRQRLGGMLLACLVLIAIASVSSFALGDRSGRGGGVAGEDARLATTPEAFYQRGTQPLGEGIGGLAPLAKAIDPNTGCMLCHGDYNEPEVEPFRNLAASIKGQSARDPVFRAALAVANQDASGAGQYCIRCHVPVAFLEGRHLPPDGSAFTDADLEGLSCAFCHRVVDPNFEPFDPPNLGPAVVAANDEPILAALDAAGHAPFEPGNAQYVIDPVDNRRGPRYDLFQNLHVPLPEQPAPQVIYSPFHKSSEFCWNCHDVSNPLLVRDGNTYVLGHLDEPHPTGSQKDMFPLHRTYQEWLNSYYSTIGVDHAGRFGGNHPTGIMKVCQDCHMPKYEGHGCSVPFILRPDVAQHSFLGSNTWVMRAVRDLYSDEVTGLTEQSVENAIANNIDFLQKASDLEVLEMNDQIRVRIFNRTGHKLPTGFPDGRRMWINVKFLDEDENLIKEHGAYDFETAELLADDSKVYEALLGVDADQAAATGLPEGKTFHFTLANTFIKDNRIPPAGWFNSVAVQNQTAPVGVSYFSGEHWDDTFFDVPSNALAAIVTIYYQTTSREFIEFLRDNDLGEEGLGKTAYDLWVKHGKSQPVIMDMAEVEFCHPADLDCDGAVGVPDLLMLLAVWGECPQPGPCPGDLTGSGSVGVPDLLQLLSNWGNL